jgi:hypothetical protein
MAYYAVTTKQLVSTVAAICMTVAATMWFMKTLTDYLDLPKVHVSNGACLKVVNYKNGDAFSCQDKDVTLRKYITVTVQ